jgi:TonB-linked SusC/RagA family outer membrane protein
MKWSLCIPLLVLAQFHATLSVAQTAPVVVSRNEISLKALIREIEEQTEYLFIYNKKDVDESFRVRLSGREKNVREILDTALAPTNLTYQIESNYISLRAKAAGTQTPERNPPPRQRRSGIIIDERGEPLSGVVIEVKGTGNTTVSGTDGDFMIDVSPGRILKFGIIGYQTTERVVTGENRRFTVVMKQAVEEIEEIVVVGMGSQRKVSVIGAVSNISVRELNLSNRSLSNSFAGRLAGMVAVQRSGEPGYDNSNFWIRGISTFGANQTPLILVDGVERANAMHNIDLDEIASVSILKDASATAVYGVHAANGVVIITTRRGVATDKTCVELDITYGINQFTRMPKLLDGVNYMKLYNEASGSDVFSAGKIEATQTGTDPWLNPNVNWFNEIFKKNSANKNISLNVSGGGRVARYFVALGFLSENGNFRDDPANDYKSNISFRRYSFRSNVNITLTPSTTLDVEMGGSLIDSHYPGTGTPELFDVAYLANPVNVPVNYPMGNDKDGKIKYVWAGSSSTTNRNPAERLLGSGFTTEFHNQLLGQMRLTQSLETLVKGLTANMAFSFDAYNQTNIYRHKSESYYLAVGRNQDSELELSQQTFGDEFLGYGRGLSSNRAMEFKAQINYERVFSKVHSVGAMATYYQRDYRDGNAYNAVVSLPYRKQGIAFRAAYSYSDRYFAEFNMGYNGSENFRKGQRFGLFPAGALGYMISNEGFWRDGAISRIIPELKLRGSVGLVGAEALPDGRRFSYLTIVGEGLGGYNFGPDNNYWAGTGENQLGVQNLTWEKGLKTNLGIEVGLFGSAVSLSVDLFCENRSGILVKRQTIPDVVGISDTPFANMGKMDNKGIEGMLDINDNIGDLQYRIYANATFNKNKIVYMDEPPMPYDYLNQTGKMFGQQFGLIALGYFRDEAEVAASPVQRLGTYGVGDIKYLDVNDDGQIDTYDMQPIGHPSIPQLTYGFGMQLRYKGFDLGIFFRGQGKVSYMLGGEGFIPFMLGGTRGNLFVEALDRWTEENPRQDAFYPRLHIMPSDNNYYSSTKWLYSGAFLRLADFDIGYNFSQRWLSNVGIESVRFYFHGTNLALFSKFKMWDPEIGKGRGDAYPLRRKYNIGISIKF